MGTDERDPLTYAIIGAAMEVHTELGPGLDEGFYHQLLAARLRLSGVAYESKLRGVLFHRNLRADEFERDFLVAAGVVAELKVLSGPETFAPEHFIQLICYLKFWRIRTGLLLDFGKERLIYRRLVFTDTAAPEFDASIITGASPFVTHKEIAHSICEGLARVLETHGLGYRDTTYQGLIAADLTAEKIPFVHSPIANVCGHGNLLGKASCNCIVVAGAIGVLILALREQVSSTDRSILQTYLRHLGLPYGLIVNFGKRHFDLVFVGPPKASRGAASLNALSISFPSVAVSESAGKCN